jgi:hypothetical protein
VRQGLKVKEVFEERVEHRLVSEKEVELESSEFVKVESSFEFLNLLRFDLQSLGLWFNAVGFILAFTVLAYMYYRSPEWVSDS